MKQIPDNFKKIITEICRVFLGCVFVFSGFVKAVDPLGFTYKITDYLTAFGLNALEFFALPVSIFLAALEFTLGLCLLLGIYRRLHTILILLFMLVMTPLTLYLAIANPVSDCGCFGDAWIISNWQTFFKNLFLLAAAIVVFCWYKRITPLYTYKSYSLAILWVWIFILSVSFYCYSYLPILDFRPYKTGNNIPELREIPEDAEPDVHVLVYEKDGKTKEFTLEDYPRGDDSWTFVDTKLKKKGYEPPISDFVVVDELEENITDAILEYPGYTFLLISYDLEKADDSNVDKINEIYDYARLHDYPFYALTGSSSEKIREWQENTGAEYPFCTMDQIELKTIIRSNPGLMLMKEGTIINKWPKNKLPEESLLQQNLDDSPLGQIPPNKDAKKVLLLALICGLPLIALGINDYFRFRKTTEKKSIDNHKQ